jgi:hypothetical protein
MDADRAPNTETGYSQFAAERWRREGLPPDVSPVWQDNGVPRAPRKHEGVRNVTWRKREELDILYPAEHGFNEYFGFDLICATVSLLTPAGLSPRPTN